MKGVSSVEQQVEHLELVFQTSSLLLTLPGVRANVVSAHILPCHALHLCTRPLSTRLPPSRAQVFSNLADSGL